MISRDEILMGREVEYPLSIQLDKNLTKLLEAVNKLRTEYGIPMAVSSGYRPGKYNQAAGGATHSSHLTCEAVDFSDQDGKIKKWCLSHLDRLAEWGLWMESPVNTPTWCHLQIRPTANRVFLK